MQRCCKNLLSHGISIDPEPNWSLLSEIESVEKNLNPFLKFPQPFSKTALRMGRSGGGFVMRVSEDEMESDEEEERSFDESDDEFDCEPESFLMSNMGLAENVLYEVINDRQTHVKVRYKMILGIKQVSVVKAEIVNEIETSRFAIARVEKYRETRKEVERKKLDFQYQLKVGEALDTHFTVVQREHEVKSQIEERKELDRGSSGGEKGHIKKRKHTPSKKLVQRLKYMLVKIRAAEEAKKEVERKAAKEAAEQKLSEERLYINTSCRKCFNIGEAQVEEAGRVRSSEPVSEITTLASLKSKLQGS
ncbi:hypothetical protein Bca52824_062554 [Brassica carinata]|uniref:Uncharacterized protein n=1 Tax=Brassica carinata TaxID=52824 RepID=A0A8X7QI72_BRACI|nr:hypothetical protein Bca52824_062554 [Brassica carinata]